jgi:protein-disulfide isomerase
MSYVVDRPRLTVPLNERDHVKGSPNAAVTLVEYGDYQCPYCGAAHRSLKEVERIVGDDLRFAFRHFPLSQIHPLALPAAEAAEAAGAQGKFWEMHDMLYENQAHLEPPAILRYAGAIGLDLDRFAADLESGKHTTKIREDFMSGVRSGVNGTPTFFVNGVRHNGGYDPASLIEAIRAELHAA